MPTSIHVDSVIVPPDRQRRLFDEAKLVELASSMYEVGQLQPIVLRADGKTLVAGERRLRAATEYLAPMGRTVLFNGVPLPLGCLGCTVVSDLDAIQLEEAELAENAKREDLSWQEKAAATARLHALRQKQAASRAIVDTDQFGTQVVTSDAHTIADTAQEIHGRSDGAYHSQVRESVILSQHLDNPLIAKAKTQKEAMKLLVKAEENSRHSALAAAVGKTFSSSMHEAYNVNCLEWMARPENAGRFDCILTDPPYGMGAHEFGDAAGKLSGTTHEYDDSYESWQKLMWGEGGWCHLSFLVCKPQAHAYVFCDPDNFHELKKAMEAAGWYVFRTPLINVKESGRVPLPDEGPRRQYEICLYAIKGHKHTTGIFSDVVNSTADEQMGHGAQKPVSLYVDLLRRSARPGDTVLDAFSGSGTIFPAAHQLRVRAVGLEMAQASFGKGLERLAAIRAEETAQPSLIEEDA